LTLEEETRYAYIAGLIDGEGYVQIFRKTAPSFRATGKGYTRLFIINISNTSRHMLEVANEYLNNTGHIICMEHFRSAKEYEKMLDGKRRAGYELRLYPNTLRQYLPKIIPYLVHKKRCAEIMLDELNIITNIKNFRQRECLLLEKDEEFRRERSMVEAIKYPDRMSKTNKDFWLNQGKTTWRPEGEGNTREVWKDKLQRCF
jgi:hypothetical protein